MKLYHKTFTITDSILPFTATLASWAQSFCEYETPTKKDTEIKFFCVFLDAVPAIRWYKNNCMPF